MRMLRFSRLCLLSQHERRAFKLSFSSAATVLQAGNGFGKSAVLKSLYNALGAEPHKIDAPWRSAQVETLLEFTVDGTSYVMLAGRGRFAVFDGNTKMQLRTTSIVKDLTAYLARLLNFQLQMVNREDQAITPPPDYMFAPFYVDQDNWRQPWASFRGLYMANSKQTLADYHSGLKPNAYYAAQARRNLLQAQRKALEGEREVLHQTLESMRELVSDVVLSFDLTDFQVETEQLLAESRKLHQDQLAYRQRLSNISEERRLWLEQRDLVKATLAEMDEAFAAALDRPADVACPTCGHHYHNSIADQFEIVRDKDGLFNSLIVSQEKLHELDDKAKAERKNISELEDCIARINHILGARKEELSFNDVIAAQGRNEAGRIIRGRISTIDEGISDKRRQEDDETRAMQAAVSRKRSQEIKAYFKDRLFEFCDHLSVRLDTTKQPSMTIMPFGRGSEGPRGLIAYYYAFLHTARRYSSSSFCPIVIDAPNQQGQDDMRRVMRFIIDKRPADSQVIVATEDLFSLTDNDAKIVRVGKRKNLLLDEDLYDEVSDVVRPYLGQLI
ncbi:coiled-coil domain-containing protein [Muricoccus vinaceus]|uniref:Rad50/SbcC-type AAA domain-containing protein n=1 Tax=Muricoccus vinaceus TaxID=424704 RepID=A0ABV6IT62_9PROT